MRHRTSRLLLAGLLLLATPLSAQEPDANSDGSEAAPPGWTQPLEGIEEPLFGSRSDVGLMIVTPQTGGETGEQADAVAKLIRDKAIASQLVGVVMDDAPLGDVSTKSDEEILQAAKKYPVDVVAIVRAFPGSDGPVAVLRIETVGERSLSFRFTPGGEPPWSQKPTAADPEETTKKAELVATTRADESARAMSAHVRMGAVGVTETVRLVADEESRRRLSFERTGGFGHIVATTGERIAWPQAYETIADEEVARSYRTRRALRTATLVSGGVLSGAGFGLLFVGLANQANCSGGTSGCGRPALVGAGALTLTAGVLSLATGLIIRPHPLTPDEVEERVRTFNGTVTPSPPAEGEPPTRP